LRQPYRVREDLSWRFFYPQLHVGLSRRYRPPLRLVATLLETPLLPGNWQPSMDGTSRTNQEIPVRNSARGSRWQRICAEGEKPTYSAMLLTVVGAKRCSSIRVAADKCPRRERKASARAFVRPGTSLSAQEGDSAKQSSQSECSVSLVAHSENELQCKLNFSTAGGGGIKSTRCSVERSVLAKQDVVDQRRVEIGVI
jgi:hypothetical protein